MTTAPAAITHPCPTVTPGPHSQISLSAEERVRIDDRGSMYRMSEAGPRPCAQHSWKNPAVNKSCLYVTQHWTEHRSDLSHIASVSDQSPHLCQVKTTVVRLDFNLALTPVSGHGLSGELDLCGLRQVLHLEVHRCDIPDR